MLFMTCLNYIIFQQLISFKRSIFSYFLSLAVRMQEYHLLSVKSNLFGGIQVQCPGECGIDCWRSLFSLNLSSPSFHFLLQVSDSFSRGTLH